MRISVLLVCMLGFFLAAQARITSLPNAAQQLKIDSILKCYHTAKTDTGKLNSLFAVTDAYYDISDFKNTLLYNKYKRMLSEKLKRSKDKNDVLAGRKGEASYYLYIGEVSMKQSNYPAALSNYLQALDLFFAIGDRQQTAVLFSDIASVYSAMGNYNESLSYSFKALKLEEALNNEDHVAIELNNIGAIYNDIRNFSKSLVYFIKAKDISQKKNDKKSTALYTSNIGHCYQRLCDSAYEKGNIKLSLELQDKALDYYFKSLKMSGEVSDKDNASVCLENIGIIFSNVSEYKKALPYFLKALDIYKELGLNAEQSHCLIMIGTAYNGLGQNKNAEECYGRALYLAKQTHSNYYLMEANLGNSEFYEKTKRPAKAFDYYKNYIVYRDSIFNRENSNALVRTELNYEFEKKQAAIKFENDRVVYRLEADNKLYKQWRLFFIVMIILVVIILFFVKRAYDNKKKIAEFMSSENTRKEVLLQEVHHRINNNLQIISSLLTLQANNAENEKLTEYLIQSQNRIQSLSALHELLYDTNSPLEINMKDYINKVLDFHREVSGSLTGKIVIEESIESVRFPTKLAVPIALIINELVTNAIKYAFTANKEGTIKVELVKNTANNWSVIVSDNGKGLPQETGRRKDSLGLKLVTILSKQIRATFISKNETGAFFSITFDLTKTK